MSSLRFRGASGNVSILLPGWACARGRVNHGLFSNASGKVAQRAMQNRRKAQNEGYQVSLSTDHDLSSWLLVFESNPIPADIRPCLDVGSRSDSVLGMK